MQRLTTKQRVDRLLFQYPEHITSGAVLEINKAYNNKDLLLIDAIVALYERNIPND